MDNDLSKNSKKKFEIVFSNQSSYMPKLRNHSKKSSAALSCKTLKKLNNTIQCARKNKFLFGANLSPCIGRNFQTAPNSECARKNPTRTSCLNAVDPWAWGIMLKRIDRFIDCIMCGGSRLSNLHGVLSITWLTSLQERRKVIRLVNFRIPIFWKLFTL